MFLHETIRTYHVILASQSPRRHELMKGLQIEFEILLKDIVEDYPKQLIGKEVPSFLARLKCEAYQEQLACPQNIIITADTVVLLGDEVLEKPTSEEHAKQMLRRLSQQTHVVVTAVCIGCGSRRMEFSCSTQVTFGVLSEEEIDYYVTNYHPMDKAGAYGVQEWIGYIAIESITGSYFNVMGLPVYQLYQKLNQFITS